MAEKVSCPYCDKAVTDDLTGCPHCGAPLNPQLLKAAAKPKAAPQKPEESDERCPSCDAPVQKGDIICTQCGTNLLTGQKVVQEQAQRAKKVQSTDKKPVVMGVLLVVALFAVGGLIWWLNQDPVGQAEKLMQEGEPLTALQVLEKYLEDFPEDADANMLLGTIYLEPDMSQFDQAAKAFSKAYTIDSGRTEAAYLAVIAASRMPGDAYRAMEIDQLQALVTKHPGEARAFRMLGLAHGGMGNTAEQIAALEQALALDDDPATHVALALAMLQQNDPAAARSHMDQGLTGGSSPMVQAAVKSIIAAQEGNAGESVMLLEQASSGEDALASANALLAASALENGQPQRARTLLEALRRKGSLSPASQFLYGLSLQALEANQEALSEFDRIAARKGPFSEQSALQIAEIQLNLGDETKVTNALRQAGALGDSPQGHTLRGRLFAMQGQWNDAAREVREAIVLDRSYAPARLENGLLFLMRGVEVEGIRELEAYLALLDADAQNAHVNEIKLLLEQFKVSLAGNLSAQATR